MTQLYVEEAITFLVNKCHNQAYKSGFWDDVAKTYDKLQDGNIEESAALLKKYVVDIKLSKMALVGSEIGEAVEGIRKPGPDQHLPDLPSEAVELADAIIRIFDYCGYFSIPLGEALEKKMAYNATRPYKHGKEA